MKDNDSNVTSDEDEDKVILNNIILKEGKKRKLIKEDVIRKKRKIELTYICLDYIEENLLIKEYMLMNDEDKNLYLSLYADNILHILKEKLNKKIEDNHFIFINGKEVCNINDLKEKNNEEQKEFLVIDKETFECEELLFYERFRFITNTDDINVEKSIQKKKLERDFGDLGLLMFQYYCMELKANRLYIKYN